MPVHQAKSNKNYPCSSHHMTGEGQAYFIILIEYDVFFIVTLDG